MSTAGGQLIVVPLDGSRNAENAVPWAALLARLYDAKVLLVHVTDHEGGSGEQALATAGETFRPYADHLAKSWEIAAWEAAVLRSVNAAAAILEAADDAHFIVIASHGRGGFHATFVGSVADKVVRGARIPVLLVPGVGSPAAPDRAKPVLVALDGSEAGERALRLGRELARRMQWPVALLRVWSIPANEMNSFPPYSYGYSPAEEFNRALSTAADDYIRGLLRPGEKGYVAEGAPATSIADTAARLDAGMVVVSSSGKGLAARIALGSTTDRLIHTLHRPLLIAREA